MNKELGLEYCESLRRSYDGYTESEKKTTPAKEMKYAAYSAITALQWAEIISDEEREEFLARLGWGM